MFGRHLLRGRAGIDILDPKLEHADLERGRRHSTVDTVRGHTCAEPVAATVPLLRVSYRRKRQNVSLNMDNVNQPEQPRLPKTRLTTSRMRAQRWNIFRPN